MASRLLDQVTASDAMSHDQTPTRPASSAVRTVAVSGKNSFAPLVAARSGSGVVCLASGSCMTLQFGLAGIRVKAVDFDKLEKSAADIGLDTSISQRAVPRQ